MLELRRKSMVHKSSLVLGPQDGPYFILFIYEFVSHFNFTDPSKFRLTHQTSFVRQHASCWSKSTILLYFVSLLTAPFWLLIVTG